MKIVLFLLLGIFLFNTSNAQVVNIPDKAKKHFSEHYKDVNNIDWSNNVTNYQCKFVDNGVSFTAHYNVDGAWAYTEKWIDEKEIPSLTKDTFSKSKYRNWEKKGIAYVENNDGKKYYRFEVKKGLEKRYVFIDKDGKVIKETLSI
jgi:hypothetical protein